jgi:hypothetical protein
MTLGAAALTTLEAALGELSQTGDGGPLDARVERYIMAASDQIARACGRTLHYGTGIEERVAGLADVRLLLERAPIVQVASVEVDDEGELDADAYEVNLDLGTLLRVDGDVWPMKAQSTGGVRPQAKPGTELPTVTVTYAGGWVTPAQATGQLPRTLPHDLELACLELVASIWARRGRDGRLTSESFESSTYAYEASGLPPTVAALIAPYIRFRGR